MNPVLIFAISLGCIALCCYIIYKVAAAIFGWLGQHWLGVGTVLLSFLALVLVGPEDAFGVILLGGIVAVFIILRKKN